MGVLPLLVAVNSTRSQLTFHVKSMFMSHSSSQATSLAVMSSPKNVAMAQTKFPLDTAPLATVPGFLGEFK